MKRQRYVRRKPKTPIPWRKYILILIIIVAAVSVLRYALIKSPRFVIKKVSITGVKRYSSNEFEKLFKNKSLMLVNPDRVRKSLESYDGIVSASVQRVFPNTLKIGITERQPLGMIRKGGNYYLVDKEGKIFEKHTGESYPIIIGDKNLPEATAFLEKYMQNKQQGWTLQELDCRKTKIVCRFSTTSGNTVIVNVGRYDYDAKCAALRTVAAQVGNDNYYIDVRFVPYAVVRKGGGV